MVIAAFLVSWFALTGASYLITPIIPYFSPDPLLSGYIGYYSGIIAFGLIPLVMLIWLLFKVIWSYKIGYRTRQFTLAVWLVSFVLFASTILFTFKNFSHHEHNSQLVFNQEIDRSKPIVINLDSSEDLVNQDNSHMHFDIDDIFISRGDVYLRRVNYGIYAADSNHMVVKRSARSFGKSKQAAKANLNRVNHHIEFIDNEIAISDYVKLDRGDRYRRQSYHYHIAVPVGIEVIFKGDHNMIPYLCNVKANIVNNSMVYTMTTDGLVAKEIKGVTL